MNTPQDPALPYGFVCRICGGAGPFRSYRVREMMFGLGESFDYLLCPDCGSLQIAAIPGDLSRYYGEGYYSFGHRLAQRGVGAALVRARNRALAVRADPLGWLVGRFRPYRALASMRPLRLAPDARIVDVGCGGGELLLALQSVGFRSLLGVDPLIAHDLDLGGGLVVRRAELPAVPGPFDLVMFHHSLEHVADPQAVLRAAHDALAPGGRCLVRIPTVSSFAWRYYGVDWCALDAPRHLVLHSTKSIRLLAEDCGFAVHDIVCDADGFQFWGSDQYRRGIVLMRPGCNDIVPAPGVFTPAELRAFARRAAGLNRANDGDQIAVYLQRRG